MHSSTNPTTVGVLAGKSREEQRFPSPDLRLAAEHASLELYRNNETPTPLEPRPEWP